jgi:predicted RNase H-like HicB family nuclease
VPLDFVAAGTCWRWYNGGMKKTSKKALREFTVVIERDEDGYYVASVPALHSCYTQARTLEELGPRIREVIALCLAEQKAPRMKFVALQQVEVSL